MSLFITGTDTGVGKTYHRRAAFAVVARIRCALRGDETDLLRRPQDAELLLAAGSDIASLTNADVLKQILGVRLLGRLGENLTQLPADWGFMFRSVACRVDTGL